MSPGRRGFGCLILLLAGLGLWQLASGLWIPVKAQLAQVLLERAWAEQLHSGEPVPPWPRADTWPVARLHMPARGITLLVLQGDSGRSLAFGPGMAAGSDPGGTTLISGHRDTHFAVLRHLRPGELLELETRQGLRRYRITDGAVFDSRVEAVAAGLEGPELVLLTCYPFDALAPGGPLRYRVHARAI
jgi:sortase A